MILSVLFDDVEMPLLTNSLLRYALLKCLYAHPSFNYFWGRGGARPTDVGVLGTLPGVRHAGETGTLCGVRRPCLGPPATGGPRPPAPQYDPAWGPLFAGDTRIIAGEHPTQGP